ncbi:MAG: OB-fold nucleic acid binding domain-containing protein, partial [Candidatus Weimeria sp.]
VENGKIRFALSKIKGVKDHSIPVIKERRENGPYRSLSDFLMRNRVNSSVIKALILSGSFDNITGKSRKGLLSISKELAEDGKKCMEKKDLIMAADTLLDSGCDLSSDEAVAKTLEDAKIKPVIKGSTSVEELEKKKKNALSVISAIKKEMASLEAEAGTDEERMERLYSEKDYLGDFISDTPLSGYDDNEALGVGFIKDLDADTVKVFGYIEDLSTVRTKKDGSLMAFFTITDGTGSVKALCFSDRYSDLKDSIKDGAVYVFEGSVSEKNGEKDFIVNRIRKPDAVNGTIIIAPKDLRIFLCGEAEFKKKYEKEDGFKLCFRDNLTGRIREADYKVSDEVLKSGLNAVRI